MAIERLLERHKEVRLDGWACAACGWFYPYPKATTNVFNPREDMKAAFHLHKCEQFPISQDREGDANLPRRRIFDPRISPP
jgi:hypothetical protein